MTSNFYNALTTVLASLGSPEECKLCANFPISVTLEQFCNKLVAAQFIKVMLV